MPEQISRGQFEATRRDRGLFELEGIIAELGRLGVRQIFPYQSREIDFNTQFPPEMRGGILQYLQNIKHPVFVDVGGGEGKTAFDLASQVPDLQAVVIDLYPQGPEAVPQRSVMFKQVDLDKEKFPVEAASADLVVASRVLLFLDDPLKTINQMLGATKPGGYVIIDGVNRLMVDKADISTDYLFHNIDFGDNLFVYTSSVAMRELVIKVNNPGYQINDFELVPNVATSKQRLFNSAIQGNGAAFYYSRKGR